MTSLTVDTLQAARKLEKAGFTREQAEAQAEILKAHADSQNEAVQKALEERSRDLATKADLKAELTALELRLERKITSLLNWQLGIGIAILTIMAKGFGWLGF